MMADAICQIESRLEDRKVDLILRLYVDPADEDYISARWAYENGVFQHFYTSAGQALERYLKAALLLQDESAKGYNHDLERLYDDVSQSDRQGYLPDQIELPNTTAMGRDTWQGKPTRIFVKYLKMYGSPENRYAFYGTYVNGPILHILDALCHALRRLMRNTNFVAGDIFDTRGYGSFDDRIEKPEEWMLRSDLLLEHLFIGRYSVGHSTRLRENFLNLNMAFGTERHPDERSFGGEHFTGSPLHNALVRLRKLDPSPENGVIVDELRQWAFERVQMPKTILKQLGF